MPQIQIFCYHLFTPGDLSGTGFAIIPVPDPHLQQLPAWIFCYLLIYFQYGSFGFWSGVCNFVGKHIYSNNIQSMIKNVFDSNITKIEKDIENSKFPKTGKALYRFYKKISSIKALVDKMSDIKEVYAAKILLRALFEHLIVSYYINYRYNEEKDDKVGEEYYQEYFMQEFFKQKGYSQKIENIRNNITNNLSGLDIVKGEYKEFEEVTETQYQGINAIGNKFKVYKILKQLNQIEDGTSNLCQLHDYMLGFLDEYNKLSSYVHGGPFAEKETYDDSNDLDNEIKYINNWAEASLNAIKEHILLFLGDEKTEYLLMLQPIMDERIKKYGSQQQ